ncbi:MAG TPA: MotA/TolQ/ExbB proton channel family protein [Edaphocola sp.]|nr:MotA/TolQ/ExbB proton channel family protein [Edaphocola sp.]
MSFFPILLQATADTAQAVITPAIPVNNASSNDTLSLWYLIKEGGILMIPLFICSVIAVWVFFERYITLRKMLNIPTDFMDRVKEKIVEGNLNGAQQLCNNYDASTPKVIAKGISRIGKPIDHIEKSMENAGRLELYRMEKNMSILTVVAGIAPIFGFLGTIAGMIILFYDIQHQGFEIETLAGGIYTKLVTSAAGLIIGLVAYLAYSFLNAKINKGVNQIETAATEFADILHTPAH